MRILAAGLLSVSLLALALPAAQAQEGRRDRDRDGDRGRVEALDTATPAQLAAADRRLNQIYQRRIADARTADRGDRRGRGGYAQEAALREAERTWIGFRDAECRYLTQTESRSRNHAAFLRGCLLDQTNERIDELRSAELQVSSR